MNGDEFKRVISLVLDSASLRELSKMTRIPHSTIALRKQYPLLMPVVTLFQLQRAGLIEFTIKPTARVHSSVHSQKAKS